MWNRDKDVSYAPAAAVTAAGAGTTGLTVGANKLWNAMGRPDLDFSNPDVKRAIKTLKTLESPLTPHNEFVPRYIDAMTTLSKTPVTMRDATGNIVAVEPGEYIMATKKNIAEKADALRGKTRGARRVLYNALKGTKLGQTSVGRRILLSTMQGARNAERKLGGIHASLSNLSHIKDSYNHYDMFKKNPMTSAHTLMGELGRGLAHGDNNMIDLLARATSARNPEINNVLNKFDSVGAYGRPDTQFADLVQRVRKGAGIDQAADFADDAARFADARGKLLRYFGLNADDNRSIASYFENAMQRDTAQRLMDHYSGTNTKAMQDSVADAVKQLTSAKPFRAQQIWKGMSPEMQGRVGDALKGQFHFMGDKALDVREAWLKAKDLSKFRDAANIPDQVKSLFERGKGKVTGFDNVSDFFMEMLRRRSTEGASVADVRRVMKNDELLELASLLSHRNMAKSPTMYGNILDAAKNLKALSNPKLKALGLITTGLGGAGLVGTAAYNKHQERQTLAHKLQNNVVSDKVKESGILDKIKGLPGISKLVDKMEKNSSAKLVKLIPGVSIAGGAASKDKKASGKARTGALAGLGFASSIAVNNPVQSMLQLREGVLKEDILAADARLRALGIETEEASKLTQEIEKLKRKLGRVKSLKTPLGIAAAGTGILGAIGGYQLSEYLRDDD